MPVAEECFARWDADKVYVRQDAVPFRQQNSRPLCLPQRAGDKETNVPTVCVDGKGTAAVELSNGKGG